MQGYMLDTARCCNKPFYGYGNSVNPYGQIIRVCIGNVLAH